jgi:formylglycine-generating enzyme required for sulfatase activity
MQTFANQVYQNEHGFWEAELSPGITLVYVPEGGFSMGSQIHRDERPHRVYLDAFWIGKSEVTQELWQKLMGRNPSASQLDGAGLPVENVNWNETQDFIRTLRTETGFDFRLPSEAEWEKACRGGETGEGGQLNNVAWFGLNANGHSHPVMQKRPNGYGLHDMLGNVWEWCEDWADDDYYDHSPSRNPTGSPEGTRRITRGGGFRHSGDYLRCTHRNHLPPEERRSHLGLRLAISADLP